MRLPGRERIVEIEASNLIPPVGHNIHAQPDLLMATTAFMQKAGQLDRIGDFNADERHSWLKEEINEYMKARSEGDEVEMVDGLLDIIVIAWGTLLQRYGYEWARMLANEVARSNLDKVGPGMIVREDGKVQKPEDWRGPNIMGVLAAFRAANVS